MQRLLKFVGRWILALAGLIVAVYVCEDVVLRYRAGHGGASAVFDRVTTYEAGEVKGGKLEYYFDQPGVEVCVRAMFPHFGDAPCWYARRHTIKVLSRSGPQGFPVSRLRRSQTHGARSSKLDVIWMAVWSVRYTGHLAANTPWSRSMVARCSSGARITNAT
jgi:hypothetical protein